jgi:hypothetical protein
MSNTVKTPQTLTQRIVAFFNLGDSGKIQSFADRAQKSIDREIRNLETSSKILVQQHEVAVEKLNDQIADAKDSVETALMNVSPDQVATNALQEAYLPVYLKGISRAEEAVESLEGQMKSLEDNHNKELAAIEKQIASRKARLAQIK